MANIISKILTSILGNRRTYTVKWSNGKKTYDTYSVKDGKERPLFIGMSNPPKEPRV